jgi:pimeloyl-ACP methyl ester carboxylesterase
MLFTGSADAAPKAENRPELKWSTCYKDVTAETGTAYECTQVNVPLDHDSPKGAAITLALVRIPASDTDNRIGSLFLNPGGPGGSGVDFALFFGPFAQFVWGPVANQYDIVGFDPRGIIRSTPLRCFGTIDQAVQAFPPLPFPSVEEEIPLFQRGDNLLNDKCIQRGNKVLEHMSTANVARDLDLLREAVGDEVLNYVGLSYGTMLGQTYANLFPDRVGAVVIDGVLDPIAWSNVGSDVPFSTALRSDVGALETLEEFLRQCDAAEPGNCAFAPDAADRFDALLERLRSGPILLEDPITGETFPYLYSFLIGDVLGALYDPGAFPDLAGFLAFLESSPDAMSLGFARADLFEADGFVNKRGFPNYPNFVEGFPAVACSDAESPDGAHQTWFDAGKQATEDFGIFGELWTWASGPCTVWSSPDADAYRGPFTADTANPVLVIGNFYDPATAYSGAIQARSLLQNSALLSVDEPGHTSLGLSGCAGFFTGLYLADPTVAPAIDGFTCPSDGNWFDKLADAGGPGGPGAAFRADIMDEVAFRP